MSVKAKAMRTLYKAGRITIDGLRNAVAQGVITQVEFDEIVGKDN